MVLVLSLASALSASGLLPPEGGEAETLFLAGEAHFRKGREAVEGKHPASEIEPSLRAAVNAFEDLVKKHPRAEKTAQAAYYIGSSHLLLEEPEKALPAYQRVFDGYPEFKDRVLALFRVGVCQAALDEPRKARATFARIIREFPDKQAEVKRARKAIQELEIVGRAAPAIRASSWISGIAGEAGLKTFEGEVVVLLFFATWCQNCEKELPHIRSLIEKLGPPGAVFLGIANPEDPQNTEPVEPYLKKNRLEFVDVALDPREASWFPYRVAGFPAAAVIDRRGTVRWRGHPSFLPGRLVERLLEER